MTETVYLLENHLGGIATLCANLIGRRPSASGRQTAILLTNTAGTVPKIKARLGADVETIFAYSSKENFYAVLRRLHATLPATRGAIVSNSYVELALFSRYEPRQTVFQIVHDAFNMRLANGYEKVVDVFIAHSRYFYEELLEVLPHRASSIFHIPYGIELAPRMRDACNEPLRLLFLGRLTQGKGVFDLPQIDKRLSAAGVAVRWTIIGDGPDGGELMTLLPASERVRYASPPSNDEVLALCAECDMLVFPTRFDGFPVALLEAMSAGVVPVVSDLPSGVREVVDVATGFRVAIGDVDGFVAPIIALDRDRARLEGMSRAARDRAAAFDVRLRAFAYHELFANAAELKRPWGGPLPLKHGSRLDQPYLPNAVVRAARRVHATLERLPRGGRAT